MYKKNKLLKIISLILAVLLAWESGAAHASSALQNGLTLRDSPVLSDEIRIGDFAHVEWMKNPLPEKPRGRIYLIRDAHTSLLAQQRITQILESLRKQKKLDAVLVEGVAGNISAQRFAVAPDPDLIETLERKGYLHGAAAFALTHPEVISAGLESAGLYRKNFELFRRVAAHEIEVNRAVSLLRVEWQRWMKKKMPKEDFDFFLQSVSAHGEGAGSDYLIELIDRSRKELGLKWNISDQKTYPNLIRLQRLLEIEPRLNVVRSQQAWKKLQKMMPEFIRINGGEIEGWMRDETRRPVKEDAYRLRSFSEKMVREMMRKRLPVRVYQPFFDRLAYLVLQAEIEPDDLILETEKIEDRLWGRYLTNNEEARLVHLGRLTALLDQAARLELSRGASRRLDRFVNKGDYDYWLNHLLADRKTQLSEWMREVRDYYAAAEEREDAFQVKLNLVYHRAFSENAHPSIAVIAGGYHKDGLLKSFAVQGFDVAVVTPHLETLDEDVAYRQRMLEPSAFKTSTLSFVPAAAVAPADLREMVGEDVAKTVEAGLEEVLGRSEVRAPAVAKTFAPREMPRRHFLAAVITAFFSAPAMTAAQEQVVDLGELNRLNAAAVGTEPPATVRAALPVLIPTETIATKPFNWDASVLSRGELSLLLQQTPSARKAALSGMLQRELRRQYIGLGGSVRLPGGGNIKVTDVLNPVQGTSQPDAFFRTLEASLGFLETILSAGARREADAAYVRVWELSWQLQVRMLAIQFYDQIANAQKNAAELKWAGETLRLLEGFYRDAQKRAEVDAKVKHDALKLQFRIGNLKARQAQLQREWEISRKKVAHLSGRNETDIKLEEVLGIAVPVPASALSEKVRARMKYSVQANVAQHLVLQVEDAKLRAAQATQKEERRKFLGIHIPFLGPKKPKVGDVEARGFTPGQRQAGLEADAAVSSVTMTRQDLDVEGMQLLSDLWAVEDQIHVIEGQADAFQKDWHDNAPIFSSSSDEQMARFDQIDSFGRQLIDLRLQSARLQHRLAVGDFLDSSFVVSAQRAVRPVIFKTVRSESRNKQTSFIERVWNAARYGLIALAASFFLQLSAQAQTIAAPIPAASAAAEQVLFSGKKDPAVMGEGHSAGPSGGILFKSFGKGVLHAAHGKLPILVDPELESQISAAIAELAPLLKEKRAMRESGTAWNEFDRINVDIKTAELKIKLARLLQKKNTLNSGEWGQSYQLGDILVSEGSISEDTAVAEYFPENFAAFEFEIPASGLKSESFEIHVDDRTAALASGTVQVVHLDTSLGRAVVRVVVRLPEGVRRHSGMKVEFKGGKKSSSVHQGEVLRVNIGGTQAWAAVQRQTTFFKAPEDGMYRFHAPGLISAAQTLAEMSAPAQLLERDTWPGLLADASSVLSRAADMSDRILNVASGAAHQDKKEELQKQIKSLSEQLAQLQQVRFTVTENQKGFFAVQPAALFGPTVQGQEIAWVYSENAVLGSERDPVNMIMIPKNSSAKEGDEVELIDLAGNAFKGRISKVITTIPAPGYSDQKAVVVTASLPLPLHMAVYSPVNPDWVGMLDGNPSSAGDSFSLASAKTISSQQNAAKRMELFHSLKGNMDDDGWRHILSHGPPDLVYASTYYLLEARQSWSLVAETLRAQSADPGYQPMLNTVGQAMLTVLSLHPAYDDGHYASLIEGLTAWGEQSRLNDTTRTFAENLALGLIRHGGIHSLAAQNILNSDFFTLSEIEEATGSLRQSAHADDQRLGQLLQAWVVHVSAKEQIRGMRMTPDVKKAMTGKDPKAPLFNATDSAKRLFELEGRAREADLSLLASGPLSAKPLDGIGLIDPPTQDNMRKLAEKQALTGYAAGHELPAFDGDFFGVFSSWSLASDIQTKRTLINELFNAGRFHEMIQLWKNVSSGEPILAREILINLMSDTSGRYYVYEAAAESSSSKRDEIIKAVGSDFRVKLIQDANRFANLNSESQAAAGGRAVRYAALQLIIKLLKDQPNSSSASQLLRAALGLVAHDYALPALAAGQPPMSEDAAWIMREIPQSLQNSLRSAADHEIALRALEQAVKLLPELDLFDAIGEQRLGSTANALERLHLRLATQRIAPLSGSATVQDPLSRMLSAVNMSDELRLALRQEAEIIERNWREGTRPHFNPKTDYYMGANIFSWVLFGLNMLVIGVLGFALRLKYRVIKRESALDKKVKSGQSIHRKSTLREWRNAFDTLVDDGGYEGYERIQGVMAEWAGLLSQQNLSSRDWQRIAGFAGIILSEKSMTIQARNFIKFRGNDNPGKRDRMHDVIDLGVLSLEKLAEANDFSERRRTKEELKNMVLLLANAKNILMLLKNLRENQGYQAVQLHKTGDEVLDRQADRIYKDELRGWKIVRPAYLLALAARGKIIKVIRERVEDYIALSGRFEEVPEGLQQVDKLRAEVEKIISGNYIRKENHRSSDDNASGSRYRKLISRLLGLSMLGMSVIFLLTMSVTIFNFGLWSLPALNAFLLNVGVVAGLVNFTSHLYTNISGHTERHYDEVIIALRKLETRFAESAELSEPEEERAPAPVSAKVQMPVHSPAGAAVPALPREISRPAQRSMPVSASVPVAADSDLSETPFERLEEVSKAEPLTVAQLIDELEKQRKDPGFNAVVVAVNKKDADAVRNSIQHLIRKTYGYQVPVAVIGVSGTSGGNGVPSLSTLALGQEVADALKASEPAFGDIQNARIAVLEAFGPELDIASLTAGSTFFTEIGINDSKGRSVTTGALALARASMMMRGQLSPGQLRLKTDTFNLNRFPKLLSGDITFSASLIRAEEVVSKFGVPVFGRDGVTLTGFFEKVQSFAKLQHLYKQRSGKNIQPDSEIPVFTGDIAVHIRDPRQREIFRKITEETLTEYRSFAQTSDPMQIDEILDFWVPLLTILGHTRGETEDLLISYAGYRSKISHDGKTREGGGRHEAIALYNSLYARLLERIQAYKLNIQIHGQVDTAEFSDVRDLDPLAELNVKNTRRGLSLPNPSGAPKKNDEEITTFGLNGNKPSMKLKGFVMASAPMRRGGKSVDAIVYGMRDSWGADRLHSFEETRLGFNTDLFVDENGESFLQGIPFRKMPLFPTGLTTPTQTDRLVQAAKLLSEGRPVRVKGGVPALRQAGYVSLEEILGARDFRGIEAPVHRYRVEGPTTAARSELRSLVNRVRDGVAVAALIVFAGILPLQAASPAPALENHAAEITRGALAADYHEQTLVGMNGKILQAAEVTPFTTLFVDGTLVSGREIIDQLAVLTQAPFRIELLFTESEMYEIAKKQIGGQSSGSLKIQLGSTVSEMIYARTAVQVRENPDLKNSFAFLGADDASVRRVRGTVANLMVLKRGQPIPAVMLLDVLMSPAIFSLNFKPNQIWTVEAVMPMLLAAKQAGRSA